MDISNFQAILIAAIYYLTQSTWFLGVAFYTIYRPLVAGFLVGLALGDPVTGTIIGSTINLVYLGFISAGGAQPGDPSLAGVVGTAIAIASGLEPEAALAVAVPIGMLGMLIHVTKMTANTFFVHKADSYAEEGNMRGIALMNVVVPQAFLFIITFFPVFFAVKFGPSAVGSILDMLGDNVVHALTVVGGMLPALGIAVNLRAIFRGGNKVYYFLGFFLTIYFNLDIIAIALFGVIAAYMHMQNKKKEGSSGVS